MPFNSPRTHISNYKLLIFDTWVIKISNLMFAADRDIKVIQVTVMKPNPHYNLVKFWEIRTIYPCRVRLWRKVKMFEA